METECNYKVENLYDTLQVLPSPNVSMIKAMELGKELIKIVLESFKHKTPMPI